MSSREYFSLRYAVPGFVFILVVIGLNYYTLLEILTPEINNFFGVALSLFSLFAGSAIGFLIAQIWFSWYHKKRLYKETMKRIEPILHNKFGWKQEDNSKKTTANRSDAFGTSIDYILLKFDYENKENKWRFFQRKVDIYHTLSTALTSLLFGALIGLILRVTFQWFLYGSFALPNFSTYHSGIDVVFFGATLIFVVVFWWILRYLKSAVFFEFYLMFELLVKEKAFQNNTAGVKALFLEVFPDYFEKTKG